MDSSWRNPDRMWEQLIALMEERRVIPVVGPGLLTDTTDPSLSFYARIARSLAESLEIPTARDEPASLNAVACCHIGGGGDVEDLYPALKSILQQTHIPTPEPLRKLSRIGAFRLYLSTTFDCLIEQALDEAHDGAAQNALSLAYSPQKPEDLPCPMERLERPAVYHLFGRVSAAPDYVVTDEDMLEFLHALQSETRQPTILFDELHRNSLLLVGAGYNGWLARLFLRLTKCERLSLVRGTTDVLVDRRAYDDEELVLFLKRFSSRTKVFPGTPVEFVDELYRRWHERHPTEAVPLEPVPSRNLIFLSYASEDRAVAERLAAELSKAGMDVWFDRTQLSAGDAYETNIRRNVEEAALFLPLLSRHTLTHGRRFFRIEWNHADRVAQSVSPELRFIVPVAIDDIAPEERGLPESFRALQWIRLRGHSFAPDDIRTLREYYRAYQRSLEGRP